MGRVCGRCKPRIAVPYGFCYGVSLTLLTAGRGKRMAKNGLNMIDAEMHVMEPVDLWQRYIDPAFRDRAPRRLNERRWDIRTS